MRQFYEEWADFVNRQPAVGDLPHENPSIGIVLCREMNKGFVEIAIRDYRNPMGVATYRTLADAPKEIQENFPDLEQMAMLMDKE